MKFYRWFTDDVVAMHFIDSYKILLQQLRFACRELDLKVSVITQSVGSCLETCDNLVSVDGKSAINIGKLSFYFLTSKHTSLR